MSDLDMRRVKWSAAIWTLACIGGVAGIGAAIGADAIGADDRLLLGGIFIAGVAALAAATMTIIRHIDKGVASYRRGYREGLQDGQTVGRVHSA